LFNKAYLQDRLGNCRWFIRRWTLQKLVASSQRLFSAGNWTALVRLHLALCVLRWPTSLSGGTNFSAVAAYIFEAHQSSVVEEGALQLLPPREATWRRRQGILRDLTVVDVFSGSSRQKEPPATWITIIDGSPMG
jgi:hypothetical protein